VLQRADADAVLEALFQTAPVGLAVWDADLRFVRLNVALAAMNGRPVDAHLGRTLDEVLPELGGRLRPVLERVLATGRPVLDVDVAGETLAVPGTRREWRASYHPVPGADGQVAGVIGAVVEVSAEREALRRAQEARHHAEAVGALLTAMIEATPVGLAFWDLDLRFVRVNEALAAMNGRDVGEHLGRTVPEVLGEEHGARVQAVLRRVLATREPVLDAELASGDGEGTRHWEASYFPVQAGDLLLGVGGVVRDVTERRRAEAERARLLREALAAQRRAEFLAAAAERVAASMDLETALHELARTTVPVLADACAITIVRAGGQLETVAVAGGEAVEDREAVARVVRSGRPERRRDEAAGRELLVLALRARGRVVGAVTLAAMGAGRRFGADEEALAADLASRAALHVEQARLYTERSRIAATLEASLRPRRLPEVPGLELAARYRAAGEGNEVGGDFYDVVQHRPGRYTAVVGDVVGKGPAAAALTALARHTLRAAGLAGRAPDESLALLNEVLLTDTEPGRFCTAVHAELVPGPEGCAVRLANGGHPPPLLRRVDGTVERLDAAHGPLVGALPDARFAALELALAPGDLLLLYTDGAVEVPREEPLAGERRLREALAGTAGGSVDAAVAAAEAAAVGRQRGEPRDDLALLAVAATRA
jgi:PAS domain S-box-containing protein